MTINMSHIPDDVFMRIFYKIATCECKGIDVAVARQEYKNYYYGKYYDIFFGGGDEWMGLVVKHHVKYCDIATLRLVCKRFRDLIDTLDESSCKFKNKIKKIKSVDSYKCKVNK